MTTISVATLAHGRSLHLSNLLRGLSRQTRAPFELIIAVMGGDLYPDLPEVSFPVRMIEIDGPGMRLAAARNAAAVAASGDSLAFLDVDCIPGPDFCADYLAAAAAFDGLVMGEVMYLPGGAAAPGWTYAEFEAVAVKHSDRRGPPAQGLELCADYRCFWSLNFSMRRRTFLASGGFDESYIGYGGEDTDFAKGYTLAGGSIAWAKGAIAYHQYHPHHMPPVHHIESVVRNAQLFESKWGYRTMGHWLHAFRLMGLIDDRPGRPIRILRRPGEDDLALTGQQSDQPYANTASVIRKLEVARARVPA